MFSSLEPLGESSGPGVGGRPGVGEEGDDHQCLAPTASLGLARSAPPLKVTRRTHPWGRITRTRSSGRSGQPGGCPTWPGRARLTWVTALQESRITTEGNPLWGAGQGVDRFRIRQEFRNRSASWTHARPNLSRRP